MVKKCAETEYENNLMLKETKLRPLEYLDQIGFLGKNVSAAHCIYLNQNELEILREKAVVPYIILKAI